MTHFSYALRITHRCAMYVHTITVRVNTVANNAERLSVCLANTPLEFKPLQAVFQTFPEAHHLGLFFLFFFLTSLLAFDNMADL